MGDTYNFRDDVKWLRKEFPTLIRVRATLVPQRKIPGDCGQCVLIEEHYRPPRIDIYVAEGMNALQTRETLWEEWAHAHRWHLPRIGDPIGHDEIYGVIFNMIKRRWHGEA